MRLRNLFDLDARPDVIAGHLALDPLLAPLVERQPGLRVPGAFDSFELGMRAMLGQQVSVRGGVDAGRPICGAVWRTDRDAAGLLESHRAHGRSIGCGSKASTLAGLGLPSARAESLRNLASAVARREIDLDPGIDPTAVVARLVKLPGIGPWTAEYIAMRALRWPDAFPAGDLGLVKASD